MATAKKSVKKPTTKRAPAKAVSTTKVTRKVASKEAGMQSFRVAPAAPFFTFRITKQTVYWAIISMMVLALGVWVLSINIQVNDIYDQIDSTNRALDTLH